MRNLLAIMLIALLSLQASWAAAASYCRHEQGQSAQHFGHHEHRHDRSDLIGGADGKGSALTTAGGGIVDLAADDGGDNAAAAPLAGADLDCGVCQACALAGMPSASPAALDRAPPGIVDLISQPHPLSVSLPGPERPDWRAA